ncbi:MAG TPA: GNAT family N-acetyltransferase [Caulobacteraceae bacterium]|jgi:ribosomal protein S18 acetylase RimI-like enzyme
MPIDVRLLGPGDAQTLARVAADVFDNPVDPDLASAFLADPRHHIAVAIDDGLVVGFASGVHYVHPDKPPELWINEVGVAPTHRRRGLGRRALTALLAHGRSLGCVNAWVLTDQNNPAARALYAAAGGVEGAEGLGESLRGFAFDLA